MGLFMDRNKHQNLFKNKEPLAEPNQKVYIQNHVAEMVREQKKVNASLHQQQVQLKQVYEALQIKNAVQWRGLLNKLHELQQNKLVHDKRDEEVINHLAQIEAKNTNMEKLLEATQVSNKELARQVDQLYGTQSNMVDRLKTQQENDEAIQDVIKQQSEWKQDMETRLTNQEESQKEIRASVENQEAITEKMARQLEHFRNSLFERTSFLADKIEENYHLTTAYVTKLITGADNQITLYKMERKQRNK